MTPATFTPGPAKAKSGIVPKLTRRPWPAPAAGGPPAARAPAAGAAGLAPFIDAIVFVSGCSRSPR